MLHRKNLEWCQQLWFVPEYNIYELSGFNQCCKILHQGSPSGMVGKSLGLCIGAEAVVSDKAVVSAKAGGEFWYFLLGKEMTKI